MRHAIRLNQDLVELFPVKEKKIKKHNDMKSEDTLCESYYFIIIIHNSISEILQPFICSVVC